MDYADTKHKRAKRDALGGMFGLRNPEIKYRIMWAEQHSSYGRVSPQPEKTPEPKVTRPLYDGTMLGATVLSAVVAAITFIFQFRLLRFFDLPQQAFAVCVALRTV